jgi:hypothetical protein
VGALGQLAARADPWNLAALQQPGLIAEIPASSSGGRPARRTSSDIEPAV